ncbi:MAG: hypothetical protein Q4D94_04210 [Bacillota bacterium]|nr:hypothetical protein [Bacillota bacterium]
MKKLKLFAPFLMLLAGAIASIMMYYFQYSTKQMLPRLIVVLIVFYLAGCFVQKRVMSFVEQIKEEEAREGEVIEKEVQEEADLQPEESEHETAGAGNIE